MALDAASTPALITYVLDTSVLLAHPRAILRFAEHEVVLPVMVIAELEGKRNHPELGWFARQALLLLDDLRVEHGRLDFPIAVDDLGGTLRVELNHVDEKVLSTGFCLGDNDTRILAVSRALADEGRAVVRVSKDAPLRVKAAAVCSAAQDRAELVVNTGWTGMVDLEVSGTDVDVLYDDLVLNLQGSSGAALPSRCRVDLRTRKWPRPGDRR